MQIGKRMLALIAIDIFIVWVSITAAYIFRFSGDIPGEYQQQMLQFCVVSTVLCGVSMFMFRMYKRAWQYASVGEMLAIALSVLVGSIVSYLGMLVITGELVPISIFLLTFETMLILMGGARFAWRLYRGARSGKEAQATLVKVLIVGAGNCGALITKEILSFPETNWRIVGYIDDNPQKFKLRLMGYPVLGAREDIAKIVDKYDIDEIIIAMPSAPREHVSKIIEICKNTGAKVKMVPGMQDLITGKVSVNAIRNVEVEDLLGREPVKLDMSGINQYIADKTVLVTGAGGSIGSELCRQIAALAPERLLLLGHGENSIYTIEMELRTRFPWLELETIIADVQDRGRIMEVFSQYRPHTVFHAAAHKHVPLMERNPAEAVKNNVFGTRNVADSASQYGAERFVLISTDKAVNPTSVMGATKRIAEMYIQTLDAMSKTKFVAVRFGNVLGSRGSVIPRFKQQIAMGGPVTVTHPEMVRYFMTIPEAVQLVLQAGSFAEGGEIFVLDMGEPVRILQLAEDLIRLSGYEPYEEIGIEFSGIREGEKLYEELLTDEESVGRTTHQRIFIGKPSDLNRPEIEMVFRRLERAVVAEHDTDGGLEVRAIIEKLVPMHEQVS